jgi:hypothetical protein
MQIVRNCLLVTGLVAAGILTGSVSVFTCYLNGLALAPPEQAYLWGGGLVGLLILSAIAGELTLSAFARWALIRSVCLLPVTLFFTATVLAMSSGLIAKNRADAVAANQAKIDNHKRGEELSALTGSAVKAAEAKGTSSKRVSELLQGLKDANEELRDAPPASSDAQADSISWATSLMGWRIEPITIGRAMPVWLAVAMDLGCIMSFSLVGLVGDRQKKPPVKAQWKMPKLKWWRRNAKRKPSKAPPPPRKPAKKQPALKIVTSTRDDHEEIPLKRTLH